MGSHVVCYALEGDHMICSICGVEMLIRHGAKRCPNCGEKGTLRAANSRRPTSNVSNLQRLFLKLKFGGGIK